jgi:hypothetical protein
VKPLSLAAMIVRRRREGLGREVLLSLHITYVTPFEATKIR